LRLIVNSPNVALARRSIVMATFDSWGAKGANMTNRAFRFVAFFALFMVLVFGASLATLIPANASNGTTNATPICLADNGLFARNASKTNYSHMRLALHCHCCGKDENGHCNHQCCD
jgi:hypothetical protein